MREGEKPRRVEAVCCKVEVVKGGRGTRFASVSLISVTSHELDSPTFFSQKSVNGTLIIIRLVYLLFKPFIIAKRALQKGTPDKKKALHFCKALVIRWRISESNR